MSLFGLASPNNAQTQDAERDPTFRISQTSDQIDDFTKRPVRILNFTVDELTTDYNGASLNPYLAYFSHPTVLEKIKYFKMIRADLKLTVVVNGNPFYMGGAMMSYIPLYYNDIVTQVNFNETDIVQASQRPNLTFSYTESAQKELILPFCFYKNYFDVETQEWSIAGLIQFQTLAPLIHINNGTARVNIQVFASAINVDLAVPTSRPNILNQSDEYEKPSVIASTLSRYSNMLSKVPYIGPYARASSMVLGYASGVLEMFGLSRPKETHPITEIRHNPVGRIATTTGIEAVGLLTLDPKQEVTIDPRVVGVSSTDEMALIPLAKRESYIGHFVWDPQASANTHLLSMRVTPIAGMKSGSDYHVPPMTWVTLPFRYWRGSIKYRFVVMSSAMHRGRLRIAWDPNYLAEEDLVDFNLNYITVMDLAESREACCTVGWGQDMNYLEHESLTSVATYFSTTAFTARNFFSNGTLSVSVLNRLTTPSDNTTPVRILVYASACDDFEVAVPDPTFGNAIGISGRSLPLSPYELPTSDPPEIEPPPDPSPVLRYTDMEGAIPISAYSVWNGSSRGQWGWHYPIGMLQKTTSAMRIPIIAGDEEVSMKFSLKFPGTKEFSYTINGGSSNTVTLMSNDSPVDLNIKYTNTSEHVAEIVLTPTDTTASYQCTKIGLSSRCGTLRTYTADNISPSSFKYGASLTSSTLGTGDGGRPVLDIGTGALTYYFPAGLVGYHSEFIFNLYTDHPDGTASLGARIYYSDGSSSTDKYNTLKPFATTMGTNTLSGWSFSLNCTPGKTLAYFHISYNFTTPAQIFGVSYFTQPIQNQSDEQPKAACSESMGDIGVEPNTSIIHFGERVASWRQVLKRYTMYYSDAQIANPYKITMFALPTATANVNKVNIIQYVSAAYVAKRGGLRYKYIFSSTEPLSGIATISRLPQSVEADFSKDVDLVSWAGTTVSCVSQNPVVDADIPYYSSLRFHCARYAPQPGLLSITTAMRLKGQEFLTHRAHFQVSGGNVNYTCLQAISDDYSLHFFLSTPVLTYV